MLTLKNIIEHVLLKLNIIYLGCKQQMGFLHIQEDRCIALGDFGSDILHLYHMLLFDMHQYNFQRDKLLFFDILHLYNTEVGLALLSRLKLK